MDIAVVDDEKVIREHIGALIETHKPGSHIEAYATAEELLASGKQSDIVFLDIQMDGMNGIEAARNLTLDQSDILYIESRAKKLEIHTTGADKAIEIYAAVLFTEKD